MDNTLVPTETMNITLVPAITGGFQYILDDCIAARLIECAVGDGRYLYAFTPHKWNVASSKEEAIQAIWDFYNDLKSYFAKNKIRQYD